MSGPRAAASAPGRSSAPTGTARNARRPAGRRSSPRPPRSRPRSPGLERAVRYRGEDASYWSASDCSRLALVGNGMLAGTRGDDVREDVVRRGRDGGVLRGRRGEAPLQEIWPIVLRLDGVDRVVDGALHHPHVDLGRRRCSTRRPGHTDERFTAITFQSSHGVGACLRRRRRRRPNDEHEQRKRQVSGVVKGVFMAALPSVWIP